MALFFSGIVAGVCLVYLTNNRRRETSYNQIGPSARRRLFFGSDHEADDHQRALLLYLDEKKIPAKKALQLIAGTSKLPKNAAREGQVKELQVDLAPCVPGHLCGCHPFYRVSQPICEIRSARRDLLH